MAFTGQVNSSNSNSSSKNNNRGDNEAEQTFSHRMSFLCCGEFDFVLWQKSWLTHIYININTHTNTSDFYTQFKAYNKHNRTELNWILQKRISWMNINICHINDYRRYDTYNTWCVWVCGCKRTLLLHGYSHKEGRQETPIEKAFIIINTPLHLENEDISLINLNRFRQWKCCL